MQHIPDGERLASSCNVRDAGFGTGASIYSDQILPLLELAQTEVILVTCFWQKSETRDALSRTLRELSANAQQRRRRIRVRICLSSTSFIQKLLHTSSSSGYTYPASSWSTKLGLPQASELAGLDLEVKSIFFRPFSVMHPKFVIIDREQVLLPSCNVSWEEWFEGWMLLDGPLVEHFFNFWKQFWASAEDREHHRNRQFHSSDAGDIGGQPSQIKATFLPSPHSINPRFRLPWQSYASPPQTPLNVFLLSSFDAAKKEIFLQTPNLTSPPVLDALTRALRRGVSVTITTSERLMILEQLVTAGTTTSRCVERILKQYRCLIKEPHDEEQGLVDVGQLQIFYYRPRSVRFSGEAEPTQSHVKLTIIDDEVVVFGSGNMDRASWYTSQELGVAFYSSYLTDVVKGKLNSAMQDRRRLVYTSAVTV